MPQRGTGQPLYSHVHALRSNRRCAFPAMCIRAACERLAPPKEAITLSVRVAAQRGLGSVSAHGGFRSLYLYSVAALQNCRTDGLLGALLFGVLCAHICCTLPEQQLHRCTIRLPHCTTSGCHAIVAEGADPARPLTVRQNRWHGLDMKGLKVHDMG